MNHEQMIAAGIEERISTTYDQADKALAAFSSCGMTQKEIQAAVQSTVGCDFLSQSTIIDDAARIYGWELTEDFDCPDQGWLRQYRLGNEIISLELHNNNDGYHYIVSFYIETTLGDEKIINRVRPNYNPYSHELMGLTVAHMAAKTHGKARA